MLTAGVLLLPLLPLLWLLLVPSLAPLLLAPPAVGAGAGADVGEVGSGSGNGEGAKVGAGAGACLVRDFVGACGAGAGAPAVPPGAGAGTSAGACTGAPAPAAFMLTLSALLLTLLLEPFAALVLKYRGRQGSSPSDVTLASTPALGSARA